MTEKIGWTVREYIGTEVYRTQEDIRLHNPITGPLTEGEEVLVGGIMEFDQLLEKKR